MMEGYLIREDRELEKLALLASWNSIPHLKKPLTPDKLLDKKSESKNPTVSVEEKKRTLDELDRILTP